MDNRRIIYADALLQVPNVRKVTEYDEGGWGNTYCAVPVDAIEAAPTIDAAPVVHGRWKYGDDVDLICSECGGDALSDWTCQQICTKYCPHCGAKMDGGTSDG